MLPPASIAERKDKLIRRGIFAGMPHACAYTLSSRRSLGWCSSAAHKIVFWSAKRHYRRGDRRLTASMINVEIVASQERIKDLDTLVETLYVAAGITTSYSLIDDVSRRVCHRARICGIFDATGSFRHDLKPVPQFLVAVACADRRDLDRTVIAGKVFS